MQTSSLTNIIQNVQQLHQTPIKQRISLELRIAPPSISLCDLDDSPESSREGLGAPPELVRRRPKTKGSLIYTNTSQEKSINTSTTTISRKSVQDMLQDWMTSPQAKAVKTQQRPLLASPSAIDQLQNINDTSNNEQSSATLRKSAIKESLPLLYSSPCEGPGAFKLPSITRGSEESPARVSRQRLSVAIHNTPQQSRQMYASITPTALPTWKSESFYGNKMLAKADNFQHLQAYYKPASMLLIRDEQNQSDQQYSQNSAPRRLINREDFTSISPKYRQLSVSVATKPLKNEGTFSDFVKGYQEKEERITEDISASPFSSASTAATPSISTSKHSKLFEIQEFNNNSTINQYNVNNFSLNRLMKQIPPCNSPIDTTSAIAETFRWTSNLQSTISERSNVTSRSKPFLQQHFSSKEQNEQAIKVAETSKFQIKDQTPRGILKQRLNNQLVQCDVTVSTVAVESITPNLKGINDVLFDTNRRQFFNRRLRDTQTFKRSESRKKSVNFRETAQVFDMQRGTQSVERIKKTSIN